MGLISQPGMHSGAMTSKISYNLEEVENGTEVMHLASQLVSINLTAVKNPEEQLDTFRQGTH